MELCCSGHQFKQKEESGSDHGPQNSGGGDVCLGPSARASDPRSPAVPRQGVRVASGRSFRRSLPDVRGDTPSGSYVTAQGLFSPVGWLTFPAGEARPQFSCSAGRWVVWCLLRRHVYMRLTPKPGDSEGSGSTTRATGSRVAASRTRPAARRQREAHRPVRVHSHPPPHTH